MRNRRWYSGHLFICSCDSAVRFLDIKKSSQRRLLLCLAPRRVHFARPWTQAPKPALTDSSLAAKRRSEALHVVRFGTKHSRPPRRYCCCCSQGPSPRPPTASYSVAAKRRGDCVRASWLYSSSNAFIGTRTSVYLLPLLLAYQALLSSIFT